MADKIGTAGYVLENQIGFLLRKANQRHTGIFSGSMPEGLTPTRFAALVKLHELGPVSQNELGRLTAMDVATIKGVVDRLKARGLVGSATDETDARRRMVSLTPKGTELVHIAIEKAIEVTKATKAPLSEKEAKMLETLLARIA